MTFYGSNLAVARFVGDITRNLGIDSASITIIARGSSEDCSVQIVTDMSLVGTVLEKAKSYSLTLTHT